MSDAATLTAPALASDTTRRGRPRTITSPDSSPATATAAARHPVSVGDTVLWWQPTASGNVRYPAMVTALNEPDPETGIRSLRLAVFNDRPMLDVSRRAVVHNDDADTLSTTSVRREYGVWDYRPDDPRHRDFRGGI